MVALPAARLPTMWAPLALPIGMAGIDEQPLGSPGMHRTEGGGGEGDEQPWVRAHRLGNALAAAQPGCQ
jgi:hypothetical protein